MVIDTTPLERLGIHVSADELERRLASALLEVLPPSVAARPEAELSREEAVALGRGGLDLAPQGTRDSDNGTGNALVRGATEYAAVVASGLSVADAARRLGVDGSRIRQRLAARTLYGVKHAGSWRLPAFQFTGDGLVAGLDKVVPALDPQLSPVTVARWFRTPTPDLVDGAGERMLSPLAWLAAGHPYRLVAEMARDLGSGV